MSHNQVCLPNFLAVFKGIVFVKLPGELLSEVHTVDSVDRMPFSLHLLHAIVL